MLQAVTVNKILDAIYEATEKRIPTHPPLGVGPAKWQQEPNRFGEVILGALCTGNLDGKITLSIPWQVANRMTGSEPKQMESQKKIQSFLETLFIEATNSMGQRLGPGQVKILTLPTLTDTHFLCQLENRPTIQIPIHSPWGVWELYLSLKESGHASS